MHKGGIGVIKMTLYKTFVVIKARLVGSKPYMRGSWGPDLPKCINNTLCHDINFIYLIIFIEKYKTSTD